jgi:hypothetical protein
VLGDNTHEEILKRSFNIFWIYIRKKALTTQIYDLLWKAFIEKHESISLQIQILISQISLLIDDKDKKYLFEKIKTLTKYDTNLISFLKDFTINCLQNKRESDFKNDNTLYGMPLLWKLIQDNSDVNLIEVALENFTAVIQNINLPLDIIQNFMELCLENIKNVKLNIFILILL